MKISIIITSLNMKKKLMRLLPSIRGQKVDGHEMEVILRDDGSTDGTYEWVKKHYPEVILMRGEEPKGFIQSNNLAYELSKGDIIAFVNADTVLAPGFVSEAIRVFETNPSVTGMNSNMIMPWVMSIQEFYANIELSKLSSINRTDKSPDFIGIDAYEYQLTPYGYARYVKVRPEIRPTNFITGGGCFVRRQAFFENEPPFSHNLYGKTPYCDDTDLSLRLLARGGILLFNPNTIIYHDQAAKKELGKNELIRFFLVAWNRFEILAKRLEMYSFLRNYPLFLIGIPKKVKYLDLPQSKRFSALAAAWLFFLVFIFLFPFWGFRVIKYYRQEKVSKINSLEAFINCEPG